MTRPGFARIAPVVSILAGTTAVAACGGSGYEPFQQRSAPDGSHVVAIETLPPFGFGSHQVRVTVTDSSTNDVVIEHEFTLSNDGAVLGDHNLELDVSAEGAWLCARGQEQSDVSYRYPFDSNTAIEERSGCPDRPNA